MYNVPSVSEVPRGGVWVEVRSTVARYTLLYEVTGNNLSGLHCFTTLFLLLRSIILAKMQLLLKLQISGLVIAK